MTNPTFNRGHSYVSFGKSANLYVNEEILKGARHLLPDPDRIASGENNHVHLVKEHSFSYSAAETLNRMVRPGSITQTMSLDEFLRYMR